MAANRPSEVQQRPRRGSLERPVSGRTYRGTALLVGIPLLIAAFTVSRPEQLPPPTLPPAFDQQAAVEGTRELALQFPDRAPGTASAQMASDWVVERLRSYGFRVQRDRFEADIPCLGHRDLQNVYAVAPGRSGAALVVLAHGDNAGTGPGASDNASGTGALLELARGYGLRASPAPGVAAAPITPAHTIVFLSTDAGSFGAIGAKRFLDHSAYRNRIEAAINLAALRGRPTLRLDPAADPPRPAGPDGSQSGRAANGRDRPTNKCRRPADRPGVPVQPLRAGAVRRSGRTNLHAHHGGRAAASTGDGHAERARPTPDRPGGRRRGGCPRLAGRGGRAPWVDLDVHLPRPAHYPRLGDQARPDRGTVPVPDRRGRPLRALP